MKLFMYDPRELGKLLAEWEAIPPGPVPKEVVLVGDEVPVVAIFVRRGDGYLFADWLSADPLAPLRLRHQSATRAMQLTLCLAMSSGLKLVAPCFRRSISRMAEGLGVMCAGNMLFYNDKVVNLKGRAYGRKKIVRRVEPVREGEKVDGPDAPPPDEAPQGFAVPRARVSPPNPRGGASAPARAARGKRRKPTPV